MAELPTEIHVLSYNLHHGEGLDGKVDLERIAAVINAAKPDLVALQEVDQGTERTEHVDQPAEFARLTGMEVAFAHNIDYQGGGYGTAILSRFPIKAQETHKLRSFYEGEQRGVQHVEIESDGDKLVFLCTHLDYRPKDEERWASIATINEIADRFAGRPVIVAGDFNATPESRVIQEFEKTWKRAHPDGLFTYPAEKPTKQIDFIMFRPVDGWQVVEARILEEAVASDHRPLLAVLKGQAVADGAPNR